MTQQINKESKINFKEINLFRGILANNISDIDFKNIGCHWTGDRVIADNMKEYMSTDISKKNGSNLFLLSAKLKIEDVNYDSTVESFKEHPQEYELVINFNTNIIVDIQNEYGDIVKSGIKANTGNRADKWVLKNYNNSKEDFVDLMNNYSEWMDVIA